MTDADRGHHHESNSLSPPPVATTPAAAIFIVSLLGALGAAGAVYGLGDLVGLGVAVAIGVAGAAVAAFAAGKPPVAPDVKANALLEAASAEDAPAEPPSRFRGEPWASLYRRAAGYVEAQRSATLAVQEVERLRSELEQKPAAPASFEPRPSYADHELVGGDSNAAARVRDAVEEALRPIGQGLAAIESDLAPLLASLQAAGTNSEGASNGHPAKMVDALVRTAADGIEDLAAGLMRANELAGVAERVTNRATLLALNAALEATRSGSEAFASIAEETRRLAEYAREATDTISRLSNEIEMKVGETIGSIQSSSEDAKAAVDSIRTGGGSRPVDPETIQALQSLLGRVRALRERADAVVAPPSDSPSLQSSEPAPSYVTLDASRTDDPALEESHGDSHGAFGSRSFEESALPAPSESDAPPSENEVGEASDVAPFENAATAPAADFAEAPEDIPTGPADAESTTELPTGDAAASSAQVPASLPAEPKIPDWLEGISPRDHR